MESKTGIIVKKGGKIFTADPTPEPGDADSYRNFGFEVKMVPEREALAALRIINTGGGTNANYYHFGIEDKTPTRQRSHLAHLDHIYPVRTSRHGAWI